MARYPGLLLKANRGEDFVHRRGEDEYCEGKVVTVIDDDGTIHYVCPDCGQRWKARERADPE